MTTGQAIKVILANKGKKQNWLAKKLGMSPQSLSIMLNNDIKFNTVIKICELLEVTVEDIIKAQEELSKKEDSAIRPKNTESSQTEIWLRNHTPFSLYQKRVKNAIISA